MSGTVQRIGRYQVTRLLGQGGMGVVYAAHDDRLDRPVAIKVVRSDALADETARVRFRREARAAARVSHPHICPLYEFDEDNGQPFLVMELLEGEPLSARLERGAIPLAETMTIAEPMLDALAALHRRGIVHRDLKPANVFLTAHGVKLLDFGLAQPMSGDEQTRELALTGRNVVIGTPQYMAPEQLFEGRVDERADVFAAAAVIYEMLAGRPAFDGGTLTAILHSVGYTEPAPLEGSPEVARIDAVLRQGMAKNPEDRTSRADLLAAGLRDAIAAPDPKTKARGTRTRFVALPLRVLRPDPDTDFLAFSLPDAISVALATLESVVVRSPLAATSGSTDVRAIGRDLAVDVVLTGTFLRAGDHVRVSAQLADASAGTLIWSDVAQAPIEDLFQLQDTLTHRIVSSLALPLTARDRQSLDRQAPANAEAYELYLRANELATDPGRVGEARDLYERSLALDPQYAPAWAALGRARRVLAKWGGRAGLGLLPQAEAAFRRALELDPDLSIAHDLSAYVDAELGRAPEAMERLLRRAAQRRTDTGVLAGLVTTCRYAGLLDASKAAHDRAVMLDPARTTSVAWTYFMLGDFATAAKADTGSPAFCALMSRLLDGELETEVLRAAEQGAAARGARLAVGAYRALFERNVDEALELIDELIASGFADPEGWYLYALNMARADASAPALDFLGRALDGGYGCHESLMRHTQWSAFQSNPTFKALLNRAAAMVADARRRFDALDGANVLSPKAPPSSRG
jgi:eukaryotic-like serine/threonine-protein kinase